MKIKNFILVKYLILLFVISLVSCGGDPILVNEEELITTVRLKFNSAAQNDVIFEFFDIDGDGGNEAVISNGKLTSNTSYNVSIEILNETAIPIIDISEEIVDEGLDHQFYFVQTPQNLFSDIVYQDQDMEGNPIGLELNLTSSPDVIDGTLKVILKHKPDKSILYTPGDELPTGLGGETDIEVLFNIEIQ